MNEAVSYLLSFDSQGRPQANEVRFVVAQTSVQRVRQLKSSSDAIQIAIATSFLIFVTGLTMMEKLEWSWLALYYCASVITYVSYSRDKSAAQKDERRTPESHLQLMSLVGGWPGALIAQVLLRHKTRKASFLVRFWFSVVLNCMGLGIIVWKGVVPVKFLIDSVLPEGGF